MIDVDTVFISILVGFASGLASSFIVRRTTTSRYETTFTKNAKTAYKNLFTNVLRIDSYKQQIYEKWERQGFYEETSAKCFKPFDYNDIQHYKKLILNRIEEIYFYRNSPYILLSEYLLLLRYCWSAYTYLYEIDNLDNGMGANEKALEYHMFYAKEIITTFNDFVPEDFANKWRREFEKYGGPAHIVEPRLEQGDAFGPHHDFDNNIVKFDPHYNSIMKLLLEIKDKNNN